MELKRNGILFRGHTLAFAGKKWADEVPYHLFFRCHFKEVAAMG